MKLSYITDEMTQSMDEAIRFAVEHQLDALELRSVEGLSIEATPREVLKAWRAQLDAQGLAVSNLASSFFKCDMDTAQVAKEYEKLQKLCDAADILGSDTIRGFAFFAQGELEAMLPAALDYFAPVCAMMQQRGKRLLLEADPSVATTNHAQLRRLLDALASPYIAAIYDPGNDVYDPLGEIPYPDGYRAIAPHIAHVHIKDAIHTPDGPQCVKVGTGNVDYPALLRALKEDGYSGYLSLETHYRAGQALDEEQMRLPGGAEFSSGGREAMQESIAALRAMMRQAGI